MVTSEKLGLSKKLSVSASFTIQKGASQSSTSLGTSWRHLQLLPWSGSCLGTWSLECVMVRLPPSRVHARLRDVATAIILPMNDLCTNRRPGRRVNVSCLGGSKGDVCFQEAAELRSLKAAQKKSPCTTTTLTPWWRCCASSTAWHTALLKALILSRGNSMQRSM